jgi:Leucine-rich repeat (LRR) protein
VSPDLSVNEDAGDDMNDPSVVSPDLSDNEDAGDDMNDLAAGGETQNQEDISSPLLNEPPTVDTETPNPNIVDTVNNDFDFFNERLRNVLSNTLPESLVKLEDPTSPQSRALEWLRLNPPTESELTLRPVIQTFVLLVFYSSTNGEGWFNSMGWLSTNEECEWFSTASSGSICDQYGRLIEIDLRSNNLNGSLPMELVLLKEHMKRIRVNGNSLKGTLPSAIREMTNLERFHVHWNSFSGTIPTYLGGLTALKSLRLGHNDFVGTIPWQLGDLPNIDALNFESNELTGTLPSILGNLTNLTELDLGNNNLLGTIPLELMKLQSLVKLDLDMNRLTGSMPTEVCSSFPFLEVAWVDCKEVYCSCCEGCSETTIP